ncbi:MAG: SDR family oxidoreductase [Deltaproteobacteria bacterium]|nr:SDR family oxidoreductase [Deltaproteobacteria bacterium]
MLAQSLSCVCCTPGQQWPRRKSSELDRGLPYNGDTRALSTSEAGLVALTRDLAYEVARYGIRVNAIAPGQQRLGRARGGVAMSGFFLPLRIPRGPNHCLRRALE